MRYHPLTYIFAGTLAFAFTVYAVFLAQDMVLMLIAAATWLVLVVDYTVDRRFSDGF